MDNSSPSIQEWKNLYDAALEFKKIECWNWMWDSDIFGVQNPESGEIGYCCVMGRLGQHYALAVYLGTEGLEGYSKIQSGEISPDDIDVLNIQKCLMASFEDRKFLRKPDFDVIKELGLKFRGRKSWALFRSYRPGFVPWYLAKEEAKFLTLALQQAKEVALRFKKDRGMLTPPQENHYLVRVPQKEGEILWWKDEWLKPRLLKKAEVTPVAIDETRLERIERAVSSRQGVWEADFFWLPGGVKEKDEERPYYPLAFLLVDHPSTFILATHLTPLWSNMPEFLDQFLSTIEHVNFLPKAVLVRKEEVFELLKPVTSRLGIKLRKVERLVAVEEVRREMSGFFTK
jgi:hypothetical protein